MYKEQKQTVLLLYDKVYKRSFYSTVSAPTISSGTSICDMSCIEKKLQNTHLKVFVN